MQNVESSWHVVKGMETKVQPQEPVRQDEHPAAPLYLSLTMRMVQNNTPSIQYFYGRLIAKSLGICKHESYLLWACLHIH